ncbi:MAG: FliM/FliN family flagellar motor switch protein [Vicinamibacterales bacterium]
MSSSPTSSSSTELAKVEEALDPFVGLSDIRLNVDVLIGTGVLTLRECLSLQPRHVVRLLEPAGGDLSIRVHGVTIASGEVMVMDNAAALRVTRVSPPVGIDLI